MNSRKKLVFLGQNLSKQAKAALLLLTLQVFFVIPTCWTDSIERGAQSTDAYWAETGLNDRELVRLLDPKSCLRNHQNFLGCVNSVSAMAERYNLILDLQGRLLPMTPQAIEDRLTERKELKAWEQKLSHEEMSLEFSFLDLWREIDRDHVKTGERSAVIAAGMNAFLGVVQDPHSYLLPLSFYEDVVSRGDARPLHLGFVSKRVKGGAYVRKVFPSSPAAAAGLRKGDRILEVNDQPISRLHPTQYSEMLKVRSGDRIRLRIERREKDRVSQRYVEILKTDAVYPNVLSKMLVGSRNVGLVTIHKFARETCVAVKTHLIGLKEEGLQGLILDLRDNPGGQVDEAACVLSLFVEKDTPLFETRYVDATRPPDRYKSERQPIFKGPLSVLINGGSASASEIVAGSLKDLGRATLVGERSFGKGSFQDGRLWVPNSKVAFFQTEGLYYFPSGWTPQLVGLDPDLKVGSREDESLREEDLYYNPLRPSDLWEGPQSLAWVSDAMGCQRGEELAASSEDPQIDRAWSFMNCDARGSNDRNGHL